MIAAILAFINCIPGISTMVTSLTATYFNSKVKLTAARIGGDVSVATALVSASAKAEDAHVSALKVIGASWVLSALVVGFATPWIIYEWKVIVWDNVLQWGSTPAVHGDVATWATTIITCLFGSGTVLTAGHMYFNRDKTGE